MRLSLVERLILEEQCRSAFKFELPPEDLSKTLVEAFFRHVNPHVGLLHRPSFDRAIEDGSLQDNASFRNLCMYLYIVPLLSYSEYPTILRHLVFLVCAVASRFVEDERLNTPYSPASQQSKGFQYFRAAWDAVRPALTTSSLYDLQSSVLAPLWLLGAASPTSVWACAGLASTRISSPCEARAEVAD